LWIAIPRAAAFATAWCRTAAEVTLDPKDVLHLMGPSRDGVTGISVVERARQVIGLGLALEKFGSTFFSNGANPAAAMIHPGRLSDKARENPRESVESRHQGTDRAHRLLILEEGMKYERFGVPPDAAQFLASRAFQINEVARIFGMPASLLSAAVEGASLTYKNSTDEMQRFVDATLVPWSLGWESELGRKLLTPRERDVRYFAHTFAGLLKGDLPTRYAAFRTGIEGGWLSPNDIRRLEDMNPIPDGGDTYRTPSASAAPAGAPSMNGNNGQPEKLSLLAGRAMVEDVVRRSVKREADRAERAKTPWALQGWSRVFYADIETASLTAALEPVITLTGVAGAHGEAARLARDLRGEHQQQVADLIRRGPSDWKAALSYLVERWKEYDARRYADLFVARQSIGEHITVDGKEHRNG
jgi:Phage portal protein